MEKIKNVDTNLYETMMLNKSLAKNSLSDCTTTQDIKKWCKSFLSLYVMVPKLVDAIDSLVSEMALKTSLTKGVNEVSDKIINLTQQKVNLINLNLITNKALSMLTDEQIVILNSRYKDNLSVYDCQRLLKMDYRTFYRKLDKAIKSFQKTFCFVVKKERNKLNSLFKDCFLGDVFERIDRFESSNNTILSCQDAACKLIVSRLRTFF